ncbi:MAG: chemotaxis response regulator protein-glutamate methylesterase [Oleiphilaceae bacterium]|nr:chemotaxis response regulator protein-glutamate methylesterase [Oleiphilaceae bacterium]
MTVKVLIVDDSAFFRKRLNEILQNVNGIEIVGMATNGKEAVEKNVELKPDVITMDYEMPIMDGISAVRQIMSEQPTSILMFSSLTHEGARVTLDALDAGAVDFLPKNFEDIARDATKMQDILRKRVLSIAGRHRFKASSFRSANTSGTTETKGSEAATRRPLTSKPTSPTTSINSNAAGSSRRGHSVDIVAIGTSTGGPVALQKVVTKLPQNFPVPILLVQHMPATFTPAFAERLDGLSQVKVKQAVDGDTLEAGTAYLAPGGKQMIVGQRAGRKVISVLDGDERLTYKPSVDLSFGSVAKTFPGKALGIVLTGMGSDGKEGCRLMKSGGSTVWTQTEESCVVYGMPMVVDKAGYSDRSLDINEIGEQIINRLS